MKLTKLEILNFKGLKSFELNLNGDVVIRGDNATGKTTVFDSVCWLLFGKDSLDRADFEIKTLDGGEPIHKVNHEVTGTFTLDEGGTVELKRVYREKYSSPRGGEVTLTGHTTDYFVDGVPKKEKEYKEIVNSLVDESIFKLITNPLYFNETYSWQNRRKLLLEMCGDISDEDVIASRDELKALTDILSGHSVDDHRKVVASKKTAINKELDMLPVRIDEALRGKPEVTANPEVLRINIDTLNADIEKLENDKALLKEAEELAKTSETVLLFVGLTENYESEGMDRTTMDLPKNQIKLIESISSLNKNTIIVLSHGSSITMPWSNKVQSIITGYLGGEASGKAIINAILGKVNPSGKLAETYPIKYEDVSSYNNFPGNEVNVSYKESIYIGYRYFDKAKIPVQYPFGYGLSYTQFEYSNLTTTQTNKETTISFNIKNTGKHAGKEIAQVYISKPNSKIFRAEKELKAFEKIHLNPNEEKTIKITLNNEAFEYYDTNLKKWNIEDGTYKILIGKSSAEIVLSTTINIKGDKNILKSNISPKYYTGDVKEITDNEFEQLLGYKTPSKTINLNEINDENTIEQLKHSKIGKVIFEHEMKRMEDLLSKQNVNKATKVMMDLQKPLKKFYEKKSSKITKEMVDEFINIAKNNADFTNNRFVDEYLK